MNSTGWKPVPQRLWDRLYVGGRFVLAGGEPSAHWARWGCAWLLGDLNCDDLVNAFEIDPFVRLLTGG